MLFPSNRIRVRRTKINIKRKSDEKIACCMNYLEKESHFLSNYAY